MVDSRRPGYRRDLRDDGCRSMKRASASFVLVLLALWPSGPWARRRSRPRPASPRRSSIVGPAGRDDALLPPARRPGRRRRREATPRTSSRSTRPTRRGRTVKAALQGASIVVYLGHGNGWPSIYRNELYPPTQNGFGLNPHDGAADAHQYFGEDQIGSEIKLAPNAVVIFSHLCYASGNTEPGLAEGTLDEGQQRVDNYAAGLLPGRRRGGHRRRVPRARLLRQVGPEREVDRSTRSGGARRRTTATSSAFASLRSRGRDRDRWTPDTVTSGFHRSIVVKPGLTAANVLGGAVRIRPVDGRPAAGRAVAVGLGRDVRRAGPDDAADGRLDDDFVPSLVAGRGRPPAGRS